MSEILQTITHESNPSDALTALQALRSSLENKSPMELKEVALALADKKTELAIGGDDAVLQELLSLERQIADMQTGPAETVAATVGAIVDDGIESITPAYNKAKEYAKETTANAVELAQGELHAHLLNPHKTMGEKIIRYAGIGVLGYSAYRLASWFLRSDPAKKPPTTFMGRIGSWLWKGAKTLGIASLAAIAVNKFAPKTAPEAPSA